MNSRLHPLFYILSCGLFLYLIHAFYGNGYLNLFVDAKVNFIYTNYFLNHLMSGVYPFWTPFSSWGRPDDFLTHVIGEFNPFLYTIAVLQKLGMTFSMAYFGYLVIYFFVGMAGVYFLAKELFADNFIAWLTCLAAMFSNLSGNLFNSILVVLIFVPSVWFFYFLIAFTKNAQKTSLLGLTFWLMVLVTTYMPFHFLVVFLAFLTFYMCFYAPQLPSIIIKYFNFISQNKAFTLFCLVSIGLAIIPGLLWYQSNINGEVIYGWRGGQSPLNLDLNMINTGNFVGMHTLANPVSNLQETELSALYIPFIFILLGLLGMILPLTRRRLLLFAMGLFIFLLISTDASPVTGFLYRHIFFFKYFRNTHFFTWALGMVAILLAMDIFQGLISLQLKNKRRRIGLCIFVVAVHASALIVLNRCWAVNTSSYMVLALSCIFFILYFSGILKKEGGVFLLMVFVMLLLQPAEVLWHVQARFAPNRQLPPSWKLHTYQESMPKFNYLRPTIDQDALMTDDTMDLADINDRSGFENNWQYYRTRWSLTALQNFSSRKDFQEYVRHKFTLYPPAQNLSLGPSENIPMGQWINGESDRFKVTSFDMNDIRLTTKFKQDQQLVYNDSFHSDWHAFINGHPVAITRANVAFKGIYLPAGNNEVLFSFHTPFYRGFFIFLIFYFNLIVIMLIFLFFRRSKNAIVL